MRYTEGSILDYGALNDVVWLNASLVDRSAWEVFWNHNVQIRSDTMFDFGVYYGEAKFRNSTASFDRNSDYWGVKGGLTFQLH